MNGHERERAMQTKLEEIVTSQRPWKESGAASGVVASLLLVLSLLAFLSTDPSGQTPFPSIEDAQDAPAYLAANLSSFRITVLLTTLGMLMFLWFVGSLWSTLYQAEGVPSRGSTLVVIGAVVGSGMMLVSAAMSYTAGLSTSPAQAADVPTIYTAAAVAFALGGAGISLFLFAVGKVVLRTGVLGRWVGWLSLTAGLLASLAVIAPFWESGPLNPATGLLGRWLWWGAFVLWLLAVSIGLTIREHKAQSDQVGDSLVDGTVVEANV
jgi:hypothetical protein